MPDCDPVNCSPPGFPVHGISQARIPEKVAISFSRRSSQPRDQALSPESPALAGGFDAFIYPSMITTVALDAYHIIVTPGND